VPKFNQDNIAVKANQEVSQIGTLRKAIKLPSRCTQRAFIILARSAYRSAPSAMKRTASRFRGKQGVRGAARETAEH